MSKLDSTYRGRFAPSPSGPLHAGSLVAALASYLDAKAHDGMWILRIENIDPPREMPGAETTILRQLEAHGLNWDEQVYWQADSAELFQQTIDYLIHENLAYYCNCTRKEIQARGGHYDGHCRNRNRDPEKASVRFWNQSQYQSFDDRLLGKVTIPPEFSKEDFVLKRRDGLWAYQLAVVVDDYQQGISHVVRGQDLLFPTVWQMSLWNACQKAPAFQLASGALSKPQYAHVKLQLDRHGNKLSKQNHAPAINNETASKNLTSALKALDIFTPNALYNAPINELLSFGVESWRHKHKTTIG